jgi:hypothetical protein
VGDVVMNIFFTFILLKFLFMDQSMLIQDPCLFQHAQNSLVLTREEVFMEGPIEPNMGPCLADVLLCTFEGTNAGFSSFPVRKLLD